MNDTQIITPPDYDSPTELKHFLNSESLGMQKKFGQNFMVNRIAREEIVALLNLNANTKVWEIGAGLGAMTDLLLKQNANVTAFEIDNGFIRCLKSFFGAKSNFRLVEGDVQNTWRKELKENGKPEVFFGNLPYNISLQLISSLIEEKLCFETMLITVQKEAAERMLAKPNNKNYTVISVLCGLFYEAKIIRILPESFFWPQPNVESAVVLFTKKINITDIDNFNMLVSIVKTLFSSRRKTIKNNLGVWLGANNFECTAEEILNICNINKTLRAECLSINQFLTITNSILKCRYNNEK